MRILPLLATLSATLLPVPLRSARASGPEAPTVTTERRSAQRDDVPMAVTVFRTSELDAMNAETTLDLQHHVPGLVMKPASVTGQPYIRGVGSDLLSVGADPSVATFVDDIYQPREVAAIQYLYDVDRVEVARGPLGTLYGRNATGGAVRIFSKTPEPFLGAEGDIRYGNFDWVRMRGALNVPLAAEGLAMRVSGLVSRRDGFSRNIFLGKELDDEDYRGVRAQLLAKLTEDLELLLSGDYATERDTRNQAPQPDPDCCVNAGVLLGGTIPSDPRELRNDVQNRNRYDARGGSARLVWDLDAFELTSLSGYRETQLHTTMDLDLTEVPFALAETRERSQALSQELQLAYDAGGAFDALLGLYYMHEDASQTFPVDLLLLGLQNDPDGDVDTDAFAAFGEARYRITDQWRATVGLRVSFEDRALDYAERMSAGPLVQQIELEDQQDWTGFMPRFVIEYMPREALLAYFSVSRGYKAGGYNTLALQPSFDPETVWSYELGLKGVFFDERANLRMAAFWYDYRDLQLLSLPPGVPGAVFPIVRNAAEATIRGLEAELSLEPLRHLDVELTLALLDARFDEFDSIDSNRPADDPDRSGDPLPQAPELTTSGSVSYTLDFGRGGALVPRLGWSWRSRTWYNPFQDPAVKQGSYGLLDVSLRYMLPGGRWSLALIGENLTDETYAASIFRADPTFGAIRFWGPPRTFAVQFAGAL